MRRKTKTFWWILLAVALLVVGAIVVFNIINQGTALNFTQKKALIETGKYNDKQTEPIVIQEIIWDAYNILAWLFIFMFALVGFIVSFNPSGFSTLFLWLFYGIGGLCYVAAILILFRKDKLVIKKDKIVNTHKYMLFQTKHDEIMKKDIKAVVVTVNPATERSFLTITSDDKTIIFGKKLPMSDLKWVKKFLINEIIKDDE